MRPRQLHHPLQVGADHAVLRGGRRHLLQAVELAGGLLLGLLRHLRRGDALAKPLGLGLLVPALPQLLADRLELLAQHEVALRLADVGLDLLADLTLDLHDLALARDPVEHQLEPIGNIELLEHRLLARDVEVEIRAGQVRQLGGVVHAAGEQLQLVRQTRALRHQGGELLRHVAHQRGGFHRVEFAGLAQGLDLAAQEGHLGRELLHARPGHPLHEQPVGVVRELQHLGDAHHGANAVDVLSRRASLERAPHRHAHQQPVRRQQHLVDQPLRTLRAHQERREQERKEHRVLEREHRKHVGDLGELHLPVGAAFHGDDRALTLFLGANQIRFIGHIRHPSPTFPTRSRCCAAPAPASATSP